MLKKAGGWRERERAKARERGRANHNTQFILELFTIIDRRGNQNEYNMRGQTII